MGILIHITFNIMLVLFVIHEGVLTSQKIKIGLPCDPKIPFGRTFVPSSVCGTAKSVCNQETKLCDCKSHANPKSWRRTYEDGECRLLPGSRCISNQSAWGHPEFDRCVKNAKCVSNGPRDEMSSCMQDAVCERGDGNCVCESGLTCLDKRIPAPPKSN